MSAAAGSAVRNNHGKKKTIMKGTLRDVSHRESFRHGSSAKVFEQDAQETEMPAADKRIYSGTFDKKVSTIECLLCLAQSVTTMCPYCCAYCCVCLTGHLSVDSQV